MLLPKIVFLPWSLHPKTAYGLAKLALDLAGNRKTRIRFLNLVRELDPKVNFDIDFEPGTVKFEPIPRDA